MGVDAVLRLLDARTTPLESELVSSQGVVGRVLAASVVSPVNVPGFARSAMDGFAVRAVDMVLASETAPVVLSVLGESRPARPYVGALQAGQAVSITTGAPLPTGADAVVMAEKAELRPDGTLLVAEPVAEGRHVSKVGEDVGRGVEVLPAGRAVRPQDLGMLASIGVRSVEVVRRPRTAILVTGNELLPPGSMPEGYKIVDSNSPMLGALIARDGGVCKGVRYVPDDEAHLREAILESLETADVILMSGGTSVGTEDFTPRVVAELGELAVHGIAMKPAGPTGVAFLQSRGSRSTVPLFLLPGNPVSCLCAYDLFAGRVLRRLGGRAWELPYQRASLPLTGEIVSAPGRVDYVRVKVDAKTVKPLGAGGASNLSSAVNADGFVLVPHERGRLAAGEVVEVWLYS